MTPESCLNGINHSLAEIDEELLRLRPRYIRFTHVPRADKEIPEMNELLEQRNLVVEMGRMLIGETNG